MLSQYFYEVHKPKSYQEVFPMDHGLSKASHPCHGSWSQASWWSSVLIGVESWQEQVWLI